MARRYTYVVGQSITDVNIRAYMQTWDEICELFTDMRVNNIEPYTAAQFAEMPKDRQNRIKSGKPYIVGANFRSLQRSKNNLVSYSMLIYDLDEIDQSVVDKALELDCNHIIYSTFSHRDGKPKIRVVLPCSENISAERYEVISRIVGDALFGIDNIDFHSWTISQAMYMPHYLSDVPVIFDVKKDGIDIPIGSILERFKEIIDNPLEWPTSSREQNDGITPKKHMVRKYKEGNQTGRFPMHFGTTGWRGVWNAVYTIPDVIEKYNLPFEFSYRNKDGDECWSYTDAVHHPNGCKISGNGRYMWIFNANCQWENTVNNDGHQLDAFAVAAIYLTDGPMNEDAVQYMLDVVKEDDDCQSYVKKYGIPGSASSSWQAAVEAQKQAERHKKVVKTWKNMMIDLGGLQVDLRMFGVNPSEIVDISSVNQYGGVSSKQARDTVKPVVTSPKTGTSGIVLFRKGMKWTVEEEKQLREEFTSGMSFLDMAKTHGRTEGAIIDRLKKLCLIVSCQMEDGSYSYKSALSGDTRVFGNPNESHSFTIEEFQQYLKNARNGEYVVVGRSKYGNNVPVYLVDSSIIKDKKWTKNIREAKIFTDAEFAQKVADRFPNFKPHVERLTVGVMDI